MLFYEYSSAKRHLRTGTRKPIILVTIKMPTSKTSGGFKPFKELNRLTSTRLAPPAHLGPTRARAPSSAGFAEKPIADDERLFNLAMADVRPLGRDHRLPAGNTGKPPYESECTDETESLLKLKRLVSSGEGFVIADTPEYIEGGGSKINPLITARLHQGNFAIQDHIDLHGLSVASAQEAVAAFLKEAVLTSKNAVLIVHGRGLSSPGPPVLKTQVIGWLTHGPWRKWVMAYASARSCDGGTGATYVLLRSRPLTRRHRKK
jgi:DNA-nicking Smr family endonuclease